MKYKAVGFDYGGVIDGLPGAVFSQKGSELLGVTIEQYREAYFAHNQQVNRGEIDWPEFWKLVLADLGKQNKLAEVLAFQDEFFDVRINTDVLALVDELRAKGYKIGLLSNNTVERAEDMRKRGVEQHFDVVHISAETGLAKPVPAAFQHLADALGVQMTELIFVDDARKSLSTAQECGFTPILFESAAQLRRQLAELLE
jgi:putative hydrolase of the HAD superfamily